jgi:four helix bundle protein
MLVWSRGRACPSDPPVLHRIQASARVVAHAVQRFAAVVDCRLVHFDHERLDVYTVAVNFLALAHGLMSSFPSGHGDLADQLRRAATSVVLNIAEGAGEFSKPEKARFYRIARRSATECAAVLDVATRLELATASRCEPARELLVRIVSMLVNMARALNR